MTTPIRFHYRSTDVGASQAKQLAYLPVVLSSADNSLAVAGLLDTGSVDAFAPVDLVFAWTQSEDVPVLLGQVNFFMEFDVCFFRSQAAFEVSPKDVQRQAAGL